MNPEMETIDIREFLAAQSPEQIHTLRYWLHQMWENDQAKGLPEIVNSVPKLSSAPPAKRSKAMRPLNSFMAFRAYYSTMFDRQQQKMISGYLHRMWKDDMHKAKWALIAKAYSTIRDQAGKVNAPLNDFLEFVCPLIIVPTPETYMLRMGYELDDKGVLTRIFNPPAVMFDLSTSWSSEELVFAAESEGFGTPQYAIAPANVANSLTPRTGTATPNHNSATMTMAVNPTTFGADSGNNNSASASIDPDFNQCATMLQHNDFLSWAQHSATAGPREDTTMIHGNGIELALSGDAYPHGAQFRPKDWEQDCGLEMDVAKSGTGVAVNIDDYVDWTNPIWHLDNN
ncbi:hypothetical protein BT63DRAFT_420214 [Microthyrium microscopicum]|uniref:Mating-type protein MAT-1 n=1 Tax=Microthyrium microscopicum TaxID=703497 RepID=A0A6A6UU55_9PEZI|nr:hypothetical protein BT63DRAFT_420214 [Microthyrium microscopicum]